MTRISSQTTFFYKRIFPVLWFAFALTFLPYIGLVRYSRHAPPDVFAIMPYTVLPLLMAAYGYWWMKNHLFSVADEVLDAGSALVVRRGGQEEHIAFSDIKNVSYEPATKFPANVTLSMRRATLFGDNITFYAPTGGSAVSRRLFDELTDRAAAAARA